MKRFVLTTSLAVALSCGAAFAQQPTDPQAAPAPQTTEPGHHGHHHANPQHQAEMLSRRLNLTPDQTAKIEPILASRDQQMQALRTNSQLAPEDRHAQMKTINQQTEEQLGGVLTPDQMSQLKAMRHNERMRHGQTGDAPQGSPSA